ncbi:MAG: response regulator transcription factor [Bacteroidota bacterium]
MKSPLQLSIAVVDDHKLFRKGLISLIELVGSDINILFEADDGLDMQAKLNGQKLPDIILMDINMPGMDGFSSVTWLNNKYPQIKVLVVSMVENEESVIRMLKLGVKGYLSKDVEPGELYNALVAINSQGFYYTDFITGRLVHTLVNSDEKSSATHVALNEKEIKLIKLACTDLTYSQIAAEMFLSPKTIDGYRDLLFKKLEVKSRVGLALYAVKHGITKL